MPKIKNKELEIIKQFRKDIPILFRDYLRLCEKRVALAVGVDRIE